MTKPILIDDDTWLMCPECNDNYLHHASVTVYNRTEDAEKTRVTHLGTGMDGFTHDVEGGLDDTLTSATVESEHCNNPSSRRHGLQITFYCEVCGSKPVLNLYQHKGFTGLEWQ